MSALDLELVVLDGHRSPVTQNILFADFKEQYFEREHCALAQQNEENAASLTLKRKINDEKARAFALDFCSCADNFDEKDPKTWTIHSTGGAVDVYLLDKKTNRVVDNGDNYFDNPKEITHTNYYEKKDAGKLTEEQNGFLSARRVLYNVMNTVGFVNFGYENFHYSYQDQYWGRVKNVPAKYGYQKSPRDRGLSNIMSALLSKAVERK